VPPFFKECQPNDMALHSRLPDHPGTGEPKRDSTAFERGQNCLRPTKALRRPYSTTARSLACQARYVVTRMRAIPEASLRAM
jgi:hypothetical protein